MVGSMLDHHFAVTAALREENGLAGGTTWSLEQFCVPMNFVIWLQEKWVCWANSSPKPWSCAGGSRIGLTLNDGAASAFASTQKTAVAKLVFVNFVTSLQKLWDFRAICWPRAPKAAGGAKLGPLSHRTNLWTRYQPENSSTHIEQIGRNNIDGTTKFRRRTTEQTTWQK